MKKKILLLSIIPIIIISITLSIFLFNRKEYKIKRVLNNEYYSYLPEEAKEVVKEVYDKTGEVISTEKNKEVDKPYLNPQYVAYLQLSDEEKKEVEVVPELYTMEHVYLKSELTGAATESYYDMRNTNYLTAMKDQKNLGICWAFATSEQAESYLRVNGGSTKVFSPRQFDYATSSDGIKDYTNPHGVRSLTSGGNFLLSSEIASYGLSLVDETKMPFDESTTKKELSDVLSIANSNYEVNNTINLPKIYKKEYFGYTGDSETLRNNYIQKIKEGIKQYGGAVVETVSPQGKCGFKTMNDKYGIETNNNCYNTDEGHAMQLIGWDDKFSYSYCKGSTSNTNVSSSDTCSTGTKVTGTGAFIVRNSWGEDVRKYVYLTYNSINTADSSATVGFITNMTPTANKTWDNYYMHKANFGPGAEYWVANTTTQSFEKSISGLEKLEKVKFNANGINKSYSINIKAGTKEYTYDNIITAPYPGIYTINLANKNIYFDADTFEITISTSGIGLIEDSISVLHHSTCPIQDKWNRKNKTRIFRTYNNYR